MLSVKTPLQGFLGFGGASAIFGMIIGAPPLNILGATVLTAFVGCAYGFFVKRGQKS